MKYLPILLAVPFIAALAHLAYWLITKGIIWVMAELFNINWYGKFWVVYVALIILSLIFGGVGSNNK